MKFILSLFILIFPFCIFAKGEVLQLVVFDWNETSKNLELKSLGSGTIVGKNIILTNKHVISTGENKYADLILLCHGERKETIRVKCDIPAGVVSVHETLDVAILKPLIETFLIPAKTSRTKRTYLENIKIVGYPTPQGLSNFGDTQTLNSFKRWIAGENNLFQIKGDKRTTTRGEITAKVKDTKTDQIYIKTDAVVNFGNSGGAVFDQTGSYVGIPTFKDSNGNAYFLEFNQFNNWFNEHLNQKVDFNQEAFDFYNTKISKNKPEKYIKNKRTRFSRGLRRNKKIKSDHLSLRQRLLRIRQNKKIVSKKYTRSSRFSYRKYLSKLRRK